MRDVSTAANRRRVPGLDDQIRVGRMRLRDGQKTQTDHLSHGFYVLLTRSIWIIYVIVTCYFYMKLLKDALL